MDARVKPAHDESGTSLRGALATKQSRASRKTGLLRSARNDVAAPQRRLKYRYFL
jgi:hypothetical protein